MMRAGSYQVISIDNFRKELRTLSKKYPSILEDMEAPITDLQADPVRGSSLGRGFYKVRRPITSKNSGKSGCVPGKYLRQVKQRNSDRKRIKGLFKSSSITIKIQKDEK